MGFVRTDIGWLYLLAGASAASAVVVYRRSKENEADGAPLPLAGAGPSADGKPRARPKVQHVDLRGDELAVALAPPLARLLAAKGASLEDRFARPGWSPTDAEMRVGPRPDVTILAVGPGKAITGSLRSHYAHWGEGGGRGGPVLVLAHPRSPLLPDLVAAMKQAPSPHRLLVPLRDLPLAPDGITPSMATAAVWATDVVARLGG